MGDLRHSLWVERYRPDQLENYIGNVHLKEKIERYLSTNDIPHLLLYGQAGTGKTTLAKLIIKNIDCDHLYINASDENNIETVRTKIKNFSSSIGFSSIKIVILDECLDENTLVTVLSNGEEIQIPIKDVDENNDLVKSWNVEKEEWQWRPFYLWDKGEQEVYEIELENGEVVVCTEDHKWYVEDENGNSIVVKTNQLDKYNHILSPQEVSVIMQKIKIKSIKRLKEKRHVYDLSVEGNHNFVIGKTQTLTHNCDYMTNNAQAALRNVMETFSKHCRFILTCNYVERIIDPIQSRCQSYKIIPPSKKEVALFLKHILDAEGIEYKLDDLAVIITASYPDIRQVINSAQRQIVDNVLKLDTDSLIQSNYKIQLIDMLSNNGTFNEIRQLIADNSVSDYSELYKLLYDDIDSYSKSKAAESILAIAEGQYQESHVVDKEINFMATIIKLLHINK